VNKRTLVLTAANCRWSVFSRWAASCLCEPWWICEVLWNIARWRTKVKLMLNSYMICSCHWYSGIMPTLARYTVSQKKTGPFYLSITLANIITKIGQHLPKW